MIMEENKIHVPEGSYARIETVNGKQVVIIEQEFNPKDGDYVVIDNGICETIAIFRCFLKNCIECYIINEYITINPKFSVAFINNNYKVRKAGLSEINIIDKWLYENGYYFDVEKKELCKILNVGDICIFWDDDKKDAVVSRLLDINNFRISELGEYNKPSSILEEEGRNLCYKNAIKCESLQHYIDFMNS